MDVYHIMLHYVKGTEHYISIGLGRAKEFKSTGTGTVEVD
jgi:hypothetical protein